MRTHKLLAAAAIFAVSVATSLAQPYSQNIVGYINLTVKPGFNLIANQLNSSGSNTLNSIFTSPTDGDTVYKYVGGTFQQALADAGAWVDPVSGDPTPMTLSPGQGFFYFSPSATDKTVTLVGSVSTGTNTTVLNSGFSLVASATPESYQLAGTNYPGVDGDTFYRYASGTFQQSLWDAGGWVDPVTGDPVTVQPAVGEGFFLFNAGASRNWTRVFNPQ
jgi:hypothetical protein